MRPTKERLFPCPRGCRNSAPNPIDFPAFPTMAPFAPHKRPTQMAKDYSSIVHPQQEELRKRLTCSVDSYHHMYAGKFLVRGSRSTLGVW